MGSGGKRAGRILEPEGELVAHAIGFAQTAVAMLRTIEIRRSVRERVERDALEENGSRLAAVRRDARVGDHLGLVRSEDQSAARGRWIAAVLLEIQLDRVIDGAGVRNSLGVARPAAHQRIRRHARHGEQADDGRGDEQLDEREPACAAGSADKSLPHGRGVFFGYAHRRAMGQA